MVLDADVRTALARSYLASLPADVIGQLTAASVRVDVPARTDLIAPGRLDPNNVFHLNQNIKPKR